MTVAVRVALHVENKMAGAVTALSALSSFLVELAQRQIRRNEKNKKQQVHDACERDPAGEFISRYCGMRGGAETTEDSAEAIAAKRVEK